MRSFLLGGVAGLALVAAGSATAADIDRRPVYKAAPAVAPIPVAAPWTGFYFGLNGGYGWGRDRVDFHGLGTIFPEVPLFGAQDGVFFLGGSAFTGPGAGPIDSIRTRGWLVGGHAGYNAQFGAFIAGIEADAHAAGIKGSESTSGTNQELVALARVTSGVVFPLPPFNALVTRSAELHSKIDQLASLRLRLGFLATPEFLLYGTGGAAWAHAVNSIQLTQTTERVIATVCCDTLTESFSASTGTTHLGWAAGFGAEWRFLPNWSIGVEYLHYDFGRSSLSFGDGNTSFTLAGDHRLSVDTVRGRLSWHFTAAPAPLMARY